MLIAEDELLLREGLSRLLADAGFEVIGVASDAPDLLRKVGALAPDVAIVDVQMPPDHTDDGIRAAIAIRREHPEVGVLVLSQFREEAYAMDLIGDDARGADDVEAGVGEQPAEPLAQQQFVVGDQHTNRLHPANPMGPPVVPRPG